MIASIYSLLLLLGVSFRNQLYMRAFLVIAGLVELITLTYFSRQQDLLLVSISAVFILVNGAHLVHFINQKMGLSLNQKQIELKKELFDFMDFGTYKDLINSGKWQMLPEDVYLVEEKTKLNKLILITDGKVDIFKGKEKVNTIGRGNFVGEISFFNGAKTSADAVTKSEVEYMYWDKDKLIDLMERKTDVKIGLYAVINNDLMNKLS